jgi:hypothetical protein
MKQTAVEWLVEQVEDYIGLIPIDIIEQAKEMEKEQIESAHINGQLEWGYGAMREEVIELSKQYYNETYEK